ncbi:MAG: hypothetical protein NTV87_02290 [Ignavibacteriae bacterium]|nr:hypothetical protein [Ignavibacteriota bacterium]
MSASKYVSDRNKPEIIDGRIKELEDRIKFLCEKQIPLLMNSLEKAESATQSVNRNQEYRNLSTSAENRNQHIQKPSKPSNNVICSIEDFDNFENSEDRVSKKILTAPSGQNKPANRNNGKNGSTAFNNQMNGSSAMNNQRNGNLALNNQRNGNLNLNNQRNRNLNLNNQRYADLENLNTTNYHDDPFQGLTNNRSANSKKHVPNNIRIFTIIFLIVVLGSVGFFIYKNSTEPKDFRSQNKTSQERFQVSLSDLNAKEKENPPLRTSISSSEDLPSGVTETDKGYLNSRYNALYLAGADDKIVILESTWKTEQGAEYRLQSLKKSGQFEGKDIKLSAEKVGTENIYKIFISDFPSLQEANQNIIKFNLK